MLQKAECQTCKRTIRKELVNSKFEYSISDNDEDKNIASCLHCLDIIVNKIIGGYE